VTRRRRYRRGEARLPRIAYAEEAVAAYARRVRRRTRRWLPVVAVLVVLRARARRDLVEVELAGEAMTEDPLW
jgi:hypothetical protein